MTRPKVPPGPFALCVGLAGHAVLTSPLPDQRQRTAQACESCKRRKQKASRAFPYHSHSSNQLLCCFTTSCTPASEFLQISISSAQVPLRPVSLSSSSAALSRETPTFLLLCCAVLDRPGSAVWMRRLGFPLLAYVILRTPCMKPCPLWYRRKRLYMS